jgi:DNA processing protein
MSQFGSADAALADRSWFPKPARDTVVDRRALDAELALAARSGQTLIAFGEAGYPPLLAKTAVPPPLLYIKGKPEIWHKPPVAIVGTRHASIAGLKLAEQLARELGEAGCAVVSGLARGIDGAAHRGALESGTVAVLGGGLDEIYPSEHESLAGEISQSGLLVSEAPPGYMARSEDFPRRNRIIAGSCLGVIVIEAAEKSGSLITARFALEENREVFAVPGHPLDQRAAGPNALIRSGAVLVTKVEHVLDALSVQLRGWEEFMATLPQTAPSVLTAPSLGVPGEKVRTPAIRVAPSATADAKRVGDAENVVLEALSTVSVEVDDLIRSTGLTAAVVNAALMSLSLRGCISRDKSGQISRVA